MDIEGTPRGLVVTTGTGAQTLPASPSASANVTCGSGAFGSYVEFRAATGNAIYITGFTVKGSPGSGDCQIQIGTGAAASESVVGVYAVPALSAAGYVHLVFPHPIPVAASTRVAVAAAYFSATNTLTMMLDVIDQANVTTRFIS